MMYPRTDGAAGVGARGGSGSASDAGGGAAGASGVRDEETANAADACEDAATDATEPLDARADSVDEGIDPATVRRTVRTRGRAIARQELRTALDRLEAQGSLTPEQRLTVARMTTAIVEDVLARPTAALADDRPETVRTVARLFATTPRDASTAD